MRRLLSLLSQSVVAFLALLCLSAPALATIYDVGPGHTYANINDVPWDSLVGDDDVQIYPKTAGAHYYEKILLRRSGTSGHPIKITGMIDGSGNRPILDGNGATSRNVALPYAPVETNGLVLIARATADAYSTKYKFIEIRNLELMNAHYDKSFLDHAGVSTPWVAGSAGLSAFNTEDLLVENCYFHNNGNGLFSKSNGDEPTTLRRFTIRANIFENNGNAPDAAAGIGGDREHASYIECAGITYEYNHYLNNITGALGSALKDRSSGTIVRYNRIDGGARAMDIVDAQDGYAIIKLESDYGKVWVYGNVIDNRAGDNSNGIHFGGDEGDYLDSNGVSFLTHYRTTLYFYHNTVVYHRDQSEIYRLILFDIPTNSQTVYVDDNVFVLYPAVTGHTPPEFYLLNSGNGAANNNTAGTIVVGKNWTTAFTAYAFIKFGASDTSSITGTGNLVTSGSINFVDHANSDFHLAAGSAAIGIGSTPNAGIGSNTVTRQYVHDTSSTTRSTYGNGADVGAFEYGVAGPPTAPSSLTATAASSSAINLAWTDNSSNETGFKIQRSPDGSTWSSLTTTAANAVSYSNTGLTSSTTYYYRVAATNGSGDSSWTSTANATTQSGITTPTAPSGLTVAATGSSTLSVSWTDNASDETGYQLERSLDGVTWLITYSLAANTASYSATGLYSNTLYYWRVKALGASGDSSYTSTASARTLTARSSTTRSAMSGRGVQGGRQPISGRGAP